MAKQCSMRPSKSNINKSEEKQRYKELAEMISEWSDLYYNKKGFLKTDKKQIYHKYKEIRRLLIKDFNNDIDLKEYIKSLPKPWIVYEWLGPVVYFSFALMLSIGNQCFLKIYTGVMVSGITPGTKFDAIWIFFGFIIGVVWIFIARKMCKNNILENNMRSIYSIAFRKS